MSEHKPGIHEGYLVKRTLKLTGLEHKQTHELEAQLGEIIGVDKVSLEANPMRLRISYDASMTDLDNLLSILSVEGITPSADWWTQYKLKWDRQIDQNIKANARHEPHCCSKPPPGK